MCSSGLLGFKTALSPRSWGRTTAIFGRVAMLSFSFLNAAGWTQDLTANTSFDDTDVSKIEKFTVDEMHKLVAPIALYPDALLAQVLPASTHAIQIVEAYRYTQTTATPDAPPANTLWDSSVIALLHYPPVLQKLNDDLAWTEQLGVAVTYQMADVTIAIQQVRAEAEAAGNLKSNDRQHILVEQDVVRIVPSDPQFIYVPTYDPVLISEPWYYPEPPIAFGIGYGYGFGLWLSNDFDWRHHHIWYNSYWSGGQWWPHQHPGYWNPPRRPIPSWYAKHGGYTSGLLGRPGINGSTFSRPAPDRVHPKLPPSPHVARTPAAPSPTVRTPAVRTPAVRTPSRISGQGESLGSSRPQINREALRGQSSRTPRAPTPTPRSAPAPLREQPHYTPPARSYHDGFSNPRDGASTNRESNRGASSRGAAPAASRKR